MDYILVNKFKINLVNFLVSYRILCVLVKELNFVMWIRKLMNSGLNKFEFIFYL